METRIIIEVHSPEEITLVRRAGEAAPVDKVVPVPEIVTPVVAECIRAKDAEIARLTAERDALFNNLESRTLDRNVYALRCTDKDEEIARLNVELHARNDEIVGLRAEVERWKSIADAHEQNYKAMLRRVDEVVAERDALRALIDARPIDQPDAAMVDERTGKADRREKNLFGVHGRPGKSDRRRVAGTIADRGQAS